VDATKKEPLVNANKR